MMIEEVRMGDEKQEGVLIPCADSMQNVEEICDDDLENVAGGMRPAVASDPFK